MLNLRKVALVAAVALTLVRVYWIAYRIWEWTQAPRYGWFSAFIVLANVLFLVPAPVLLYLVYRSADDIVLSANSRRIVLVLTVLLATLVVAPGGHDFARALSADWREIQSSAGGTVAAQIADWLQMSRVAPQLWNLILLLSQAVFLVFLTALYRHLGSTGNAGLQRAYWLREIAALTTIVGGLGLILQIGGQTRAWARHRALDDVYASPSVMKFILQLMLDVLPDICAMVAAWIIYKSVPTQASEAAAE